MSNPVDQLFGWGPIDLMFALLTSFCFAGATLILWYLIYKYGNYAIPPRMGKG